MTTFAKDRNTFLEVLPQICHSGQSSARKSRAAIELIDLGFELCLIAVRTDQHAYLIPKGLR
jgi:hypothetical protein